MGIKVACPNGHRLVVKDELEGKRGICPKCKTAFVIKASSDADKVAGKDSAKDPARDPARQGGARAEGAAKTSATKTPASGASSPQAGDKPAAKAPSPVSKKSAEKPATSKSAAKGKAPGPSTSKGKAPAASSKPASSKPTSQSATGKTASQAATGTQTKLSSKTKRGGKPPALPKDNGSSGKQPSVKSLISEPGDPIAEAPQLAWYVRHSNGGQYGPAKGELMRQWLAEGRIAGDSLTWREDWPEWKRADQVFAQLAAEVPVQPAPAPKKGAKKPAQPSVPSAPVGVPKTETNELLARRGQVHRRKQQKMRLVISLVLLLVVIALAVILAIVLTR